MDTIVIPGLVLKETRYKESDRILTILTPELGVISASAQSSLRLKNKLFSACGLFCYSEFVLLPGRNMYTIREAEVRNVFHGTFSYGGGSCQGTAPSAELPVYDQRGENRPACGQGCV